MTNDDASQRLLQSFKSMDELASYLAVPKKALYCVEISKEKHAGRPSAFIPSLNRNNGRYPLETLSNEVLTMHKQ
jgi:hypothetical protein